MNERAIAGLLIAGLWAASPAAAPEVALAGAAGFLTARFEPCGRSAF